jgi:hypothetical protein
MKAMLLAAAAVLSAFAAQADEITLKNPLDGATLNGDVADMSVHFAADDNDIYTVVATYVTDGADQPAQMVMELRDGDAVRFSLPGALTETYSFARKGGVLTVTNAPADFVADTASHS